MHWRMTRSFLVLSAFLLACSGGDGNGTPDSGTTPDGGGPGNDSGTTDGGTTPDGSAPVLHPTIGDFVGINGFIDDPTDKLAAIGNVREYHNWSWAEGNGASNYPGYPNNQNSYSLFGGAWDWDKFFSDLKAKNVFGYPCVQGGVSWLNNGATPPVAANASKTDPASYAAHADEMFQMSARWGRTKVADNLLKLASGQTRSTGLDVVQYIEDWNEQDAWWILPNNQPVFTPDVYAAMASADYDGDQGRMAKTLGVKNADPTMKMVMGGLSGQGAKLTDWEKGVEAYIDGIRAWAAQHRGGSFPADVINLHHYDFGPNKAAVSPETDGVKDVMSLLAKYRDTNLPGKELWITEFGYDTDPTSPLHAPAIGGNSAAIVQGQWLVRTYLALLAAGFDRAFLYVSRDDGCTSNCSTQFETSGVMGPKGDWTPKPAYYFIATMRSRLASYAWLGEKQSGNSNVMVYALKDPSSSKGAYVVWAPTSTAQVVTGYSLSVGAATNATIVKLADKQMNGTESSASPSGGTVKVDVSETPTIVMVDSIQ
jgi:hypothetical protein